MNGRKLLGTLVLALTLVAFGSPATASDSVPLDEGDSQEFTVNGHNAGDASDASDPGDKPDREPEIVLDDPVVVTVPEPEPTEPAMPAEPTEPTGPVDASFSIPVEPSVDGGPVVTSTSSEDVAVGTPAVPVVDDTAVEPSDGDKPVTFPADDPALNPDGTLALEPLTPSVDIFPPEQVDVLTIDPTVVGTDWALLTGIPPVRESPVPPVPVDAASSGAPIAPDGWGSSFPVGTVATAATSSGEQVSTNGGADAVETADGLPLCPAPLDEPAGPVTEPSVVIAPLPVGGICGGDDDPCRNRFPMPPAPRPGRVGAHEDIDIDVNISTSVSVNAPGNNNNIIILNSFNGIPAGGSHDLNVPQLAGLSPDIRALIEQELRD